jgi:hypothetical protein
MKKILNEGKMNHNLALIDDLCMYLRTGEVGMLHYKQSEYIALLRYCSGLIVSQKEA